MAKNRKVKGGYTGLLGIYHPYSIALPILVLGIIVIVFINQENF
jgi:hypothetical protein